MEQKKSVDELSSNSSGDAPLKRPHALLSEMIETSNEAVMGKACRQPAAQNMGQTLEHAKEIRIAEKWQIGTNIALAAIGIFALVIYGGQLQAMKQTVDEMRMQNRAQERAVLTINDSLIPLQDGGLAIQVKNVGRIPAIIASYTVQYVQVAEDDSAFERNQTIIPNTAVSIENPYIIAVKAPPIPARIPGRPWSVRMSVDVKYDDGFGDSESTSSCFSPGIVGADWQATCMLVNSLDLSKARSDDIVLPHTHRQEPN